MAFYKDRQTRQDLIRHWIKTAKKAFCEKYPAEELSFSNIFYERKDVVIIQVCRDTGKQPPDRTWWRFKEDDTCEEMTIDEVREHAVVETWR